MDTARAIEHAIRKNPGVWMSKLQRDTQVSWGSVTYHLSLMEREGLIRGFKYNGKKHFFLPDIDPRSYEAASLFQDPRAGRILDAIGAETVSIPELNSRTQLSRKVVRILVQRLVEADLIEYHGEYRPSIRAKPRPVWWI